MVIDLSAEPIEIWHAEEHKTNDFSQMTISTPYPYNVDLSFVKNQVLFVVYCSDGIVLWTLKETPHED